MAVSSRFSFGRLFAVLLFIIGASLVASAAFAPDQTEKIVGEVKVAIEDTSNKVRGKHVTVKLGKKGGLREVDRCDGTWIEMTSYELEGLQPVYAAHNMCKGDKILPLKKGDRIKVKGGEMYQIADIRYLKKTWSTTDKLLGMRGDLILQSCFYGENRMKFISLVKESEILNPVVEPTTHAEDELNEEGAESS